MCFNVLEERSLLPDCHITNRENLFSLLQSLQEQELRPEDVDADLRDRYNVFRQVLPNYPQPEMENSNLRVYIQGYQQEQDTSRVSVNSGASGEGTSNSSLDQK
ncbi:uncharacterized protein LOC108106888 [Drosophila eugracilis]|uniref:uncharacterized protein LOC108106888 n=1 Tax=Drosophila eugracilis TaxID=29029 RepID=UPI0007E76AF5|nr:uncharacterized protein LOC108106888 [Drosophila eugracilis]